MSLRLLAAVAVAVVMVTMSGCAGKAADQRAPVGHAEFQLVGDWSGSPDDDGDGVLAMTVATAATDGTVFDGELTFGAADAVQTEQVHAAMTPHGHLVAEIGEDASIEVHIVDPSTLDYCFIRYGTDPVQACGRLVRAD